MRIVLAMVLVGGIVSSQATASTRCPSPAAAQQAVLAGMNKLFDSVRTEDVAGFRSVTTPDFYAYDGGKRFDGTALFDLIKTGHSQGKKWQWSVTEPDVHVACDLAWIAYVNRGSVEDASGRKDLTWLESGVLQYSNKQWRIRFVHSTRAAQ
jgi:hypothetical protein